MSRRVIIVLCALLAVSLDVAAQRMPERALVRRGNRQYGREKFEKSVDSYTQAMELAPQRMEPRFNLASALFRTERYQKAEEMLAALLPDSTLSEHDRSEVAYNLGNVQFAQQKYKEALSSYRKAMRLNPADTAAKYNYAFTKRLLQQQEQQEQQNQDNNQEKNEQNKDNNQNQQNNQNRQNNPEQGEQKPEGGKPEEQPSQPEQGESQISPQQREAMLDAIQAQEDKTQEKVKERVHGVVVPGGKNW